jgi:hypothetical protein
MVGNNTVITAAGTVEVFSSVEDNAEADTNTVSIGLVAVGGQVSTPAADGKSIASLGSSVKVTAYGLQVEAAASANANSIAAAGGLISGTGAGADPDASSDAVRDTSVLGPDYSTKVVNTLPSFGGFSTSSQVDNDWPNDIGAGPPLPPGIFAIGSTPYNATYTIGLLQAGGHINVTDPGSALVSLVANTNLTPGNSIGGFPPIAHRGACWRGIGCCRIPRRNGPPWQTRRWRCGRPDGRC